MKKPKLLITLLLCLMVMTALIPTAFAAQDVVTIESQTNSAFDYLQYYDAGQWKDLNTPRHWIESTGEIVYCVEHAATNPHGDTYTLTSPSNVFSSSTLSGLNSILMYGYPNNTPGGFTEDEARQSTACAIRFWLSEQGEAESYTFTNRAVNPGYIRAKSGYEHVLEWADELLYKARARQELPHSISFNPSTLTLTDNGNGFVGQAAVQLVNINSGYQLNTSSLPAGSNVSGYTGSRGETLTITLPASAAGQNFSIAATAYDTRSVDNISAYVPADGGLQKIFLCATGVQQVATASISTSIPAYGKVKIIKTGTDGAALSGVKFGIYSDSGCANKITELTTGADGTVTSGDLSAGTVYAKELETVGPYILTSEVKSVTITSNSVGEVSFVNEKATAKIRIEKKGEQLTGYTTSETEYGTLYTPKYEVKGLQGVVYEVKDASGAVIAVLTTDASGVAETGQIDFGEYSVVEKSTVSGYLLDPTIHKVTLAFKDQTAALVGATVSAENIRQGASLSFKKLSEQFNAEDCSFQEINGVGFVFGLYTAKPIGELPENVLVEILTTNANGMATTATKLACGDYYLRELAVPSPDIEISTRQFPVEIKADGSSATMTHTAYVTNPIVNELFKAKIGVYKLDADNNERGLAGAVFEVLNTDGKVLCTMTTNDKGYAESIPLPAGSYRCREKTPPTGFLPSDKVIDVTLTTADKKTAVFEYENTANTVKIRKLDSKTKLPLAGAKIQIFGADGKLYKEGVTDKEGYLTLTEVPAGKYTWKEVAAPETYALNATSYSFTVGSDGKITGDVEFTNEPITLEVTKMNLYTGKPLAGIVFTLQDAEGKPIKTKAVEGGYRIPADEGDETFTVDENGKALFQHLKAQKYKLVETVPTGYIADGTTEFELTDKHSLTNPLKLTVNNCPTGLTITKIDAATSKPLTGASFRIKVKNGLGFVTLAFTKGTDGKYVLDDKGSVMDLPVDSNGLISIIGLPLGDVWIEESITPKDYFPISAQKAEITKETTAIKPLVLSVKNSKFVKLGMDSDWWEFPALIGGCVLLLGGSVAFLLLRKRKTGRRTSKARY